ncbi:MAG: dicarboxylate/amino acid:cation symporter, partial [Planctomycetota bacterium]
TAAPRKVRGSNRLLIAIVAGIVVGVLLGGLWPAAGAGLAFLGELFINALLMLVVPLVMTSMVVGISRLGDVRRLGGIGWRTLAYYLATTGVSVAIGIVLVMAVRPGHAETEAERIQLRGGGVFPDVAWRREGRAGTSGSRVTFDPPLPRAWDKRYRVILGPVDAAHADIKHMPADGRFATVGTLALPSGASFPQGGEGVRIDLTVASRLRDKGGSIQDVMKKMIVGLVPENLFAAMVNNDVLPIIIFSLLFGAVLTTLGGRGKPVLAVFEGLNDAIMKIIHLIMLTAPVGIGALVAGRLGQAGGFLKFWPQLARIGWYAGVVIVGLLVHGVVVLPLVLRLIARRGILEYAKGMAPALTTAFSTASSSATLPLTIDCATERAGVSERTARFVLPLGATINMDGSALYEAVAAIFIAQAYGVALGPGHVLVIFLTATLAAVGAAGIPEAGLVTMVIVLQAVGLPIEGMSLILIIDWFLDRCRTTVNVWGDAVGAAVVDRLGNRLGNRLGGEAGGGDAPSASASGGAATPAGAARPSA